MLQIRVPARLHVTLIDLSKDGYRRNGGIGFSLQELHATLTFEKSNFVELSALSIHGFSEPEIARLTSVLEQQKKLSGLSGIRLQRASFSNRHSGFGTGTAAAMACIEAFHLINAVELSPSEIIRLSGRGGASGVGVHGYFSGGFIFDVGRAFDDSRLSSSDNVSSGFAPPTAFSRLNFPEWKIGVVQLPVDLIVPLVTENLLFEKNLPLKDIDVHSTAYHSIFGTCAAVLESNFASFCRSINNIQNCAWKNSEIELYGETVRKYMSRLRLLGCDAVGMSSVGPTMYFFADDFLTVYQRIQNEFPELVISSSWPSNVGRSVSYV